MSLQKVEVRRELSADVEAVWGQIGRFDDLRWTGDDEWEFDGSTRTLAAHGLKEELVSRSEHSYTYRMVEGPFTNFEVTISAAPLPDGAGSVAIYVASGDLDDEAQNMVKAGALEALDGVASKLAQA